MAVSYGSTCFHIPASCRRRNPAVLSSRYPSQSLFRPMASPSALRRFSPSAGTPSRQLSNTASLISWHEAAQTTWEIGKATIETGTNLVPVAVPRPIARIISTTIGVAAGILVLKSLLSTALFVSAVMGFVYLAFIALNADEGAGARDDSGTTKG